jgi:SNF2 family DNA or RNA helicase
MVANPGQMSHGIDGMQDGGRIIVWLTPTYDPQKFHQTNARLARTGQDMETIVYRIVVKGGIDEAVVETLRDKEETQNGAMMPLKNLQRLKKP